VTALAAERVRPAELSRGEREAMLALMRASYDGVDAAEFEADLRDKDLVLLLRAPDGALAGFSTAKLLRHDFEGRPLRVVFSGDTVMARERRGSRTLARAFARLLRDLLEEEPGTPLHWLLISKGERTYRYLPAYFRDFSPRHDRPTPAARARLMGELGGRLFPGRHDRARGIVTARPGGQRLRAAELPARESADPHRAFFARANPGHRGGDELLCLAEFSRENVHEPVLR
jgi:hypothetical protein